MGIFSDLFKSDRQRKLEKINQAKELFSNSQLRIKALSADNPTLISSEDLELQNEISRRLNALEAKFSIPQEKSQFVEIPTFQDVDLSDPPNINDIPLKTDNQGFNSIGGDDPIDDPGEPFKRGIGQTGTAIGNAVEFLTNIGLKIAAGYAQSLPQGKEKKIDFLAEKNLNDIDEFAKNTGAPIREIGQDIIDAAKPARGKFTKTPETFSEFLEPDRALAVVKEQIPLFTTMLATAMVNPVAGVTLAFAVEGGETLSAFNEFEESTGEKIDPTIKTVIPVIAGSFNSVLEKLGLDTVLGKVPGLKSKLAQLVLSPVTEGATEGLQEINQVIAQAVGTDGDIITKENFDRIKMSVYGGSILGLTGSGAIQTTNKARKLIDDRNLEKELVGNISKKSEEDLKQEALKRTLPKQDPERRGFQEPPKNVFEKPEVPEISEEIQNISDGELIDDLQKLGISDGELIDDLQKLGISDENILKMNRSQRLFHATGGRLGSEDGKSVVNEPKVNVPEINEPKVNVPKVNVPKVNVPKVNEPKVNVPEINEPKVNVPEILTSPVKSDINLSPKIKKKFNSKDLDNVETTRKIGKNLAQNMGYEVGKGVRSGFVKRFRRKAEALYFVDSGIIRVKNINDVPRLAHEIGHHLDLEVFKIAKHTKGDYKNELISITKNSQFPKSSQTVQEGIAEFVNYYVTRPDEAKNLAPNFNAFFENIIKESPGIQSALKEARRTFELFKTQDPRQIIESTISRETEKNSILEIIKKGTDDFFVNVIDGTKALRDLEKQLLSAEPNLKGSNNPLLQTLSLLGSHGKLEQALENRPFLRKDDGIELLDQKPLIGNKSKKGVLFDVLKNNNIKAFEGYLVALRNVELHKRSLAAKKELKNKSLSDIKKNELKTEAGLDNAATANLSVSEKTIELYLKSNPEFETIAKDLKKFQDWALDYYAESGKLSKDQVNRIKEMNKFYVPFKRFFDKTEVSNKEIGLRQALTDDSPSVIKRIKGSDREVTSPLANVIKNTYELIVSADKNTALTTIIDSLEKIDKQNVQEIPPQKIKPVLVAPKDKDGEPEIRYAFVDGKRPNGHIVSVWENGNAKYYEIPKTHYDSLFSSFEPISRAIKLMAVPSNILRAGAVKYDPTFAIRNVPRDQISAMFYSKYGYNPFYFLKGLSSRIKKDETYQKFLASGGDQGFLTMVSEQLNDRLPSISDSLVSRTQRYREAPWKLAADFNAASEIGTRVGAFKKAYTETDDVFRAMQEARDIGGDYSLKGNAMRNIIPLIPFFNARIQHAKLTVQAFKRDPKKFAIKGLKYITIPAILNWIMNNLDDETEKLYNELSDLRKAAFWNIHIPGTETFFPVPKGPVGILFGSTVESALSWMVSKDKGYMGEVVSNLFKNFSPVSDITDSIPFFAKPLVEQALNKSTFTGREIVDKRLQKLASPQQYTAWTSEISKFVASVTGLSPQRLDHIIFAYTAGTGKGIIHMGDEILGAMSILPKKPDDVFTRLGKVPLIKGFVTKSPLGTTSRSVQKFYESLDKMEEVSQTVANFAISDQDKELDRYLKKGDNKKLYKYYLNAANKRNMNRFRQILTFSRAFRDDVRGKPNAVEKTVALNRAITDIAIRFNQSFSKNETFVIDKTMKDILKAAKEEKITKKKLKREIK